MTYPFGIELEERELMAHRYLYYILNTPIIEDREYDRRERMFLETIEEAVGAGDSPLTRAGSDIPKSYTRDQISLALALKEAVTAHG